MDNNKEQSDYGSVSESNETKYDSESSLSHGFNSESETDFDITQQLIQPHKHLVWEN